MHNEIAFRLPVAGYPRAIVRTTFGFDGAELCLDGRVIARAADRAALDRGVHGTLDDGAVVALRLREEALALSVDGRPALEERELSAPTSRSAWIHAWLALCASFAGFVAGYLYLRKAQLSESAWALKMAYHTAAWHLLLTFTLFPASVWGQRFGIRTVQLVSAVFFCIHAGIAIANAGWSDSHHDVWIALFNALSGLGFAAAVGYGQIAHRDMDPVAALSRNSANIYR